MITLPNAGGAGPALVGRLAPSPTGALHIGNARSFLIAWLLARSAAARLVLRIEDLDTPRVRAESVHQCMEDLRWLGLSWDGEPVVQTSRACEHARAVSMLHAAGLAYPCTCSRREIELAASAPHEGEDGPRYPGTCRTRAGAAVPTEAHAWRLVVEPGAVPFTDGFAGRQSFDVDRGTGDFVIARRTAGAVLAAYQLAVVVDDAWQGVTQVIRGRDLLPSTARQMLVARALSGLGWICPSPSYFHVALVVGPDGRRLAKRHGDTRLATYRAAGVPAGRVLAWLGESLGAGPRDWLARQPNVLEHLLAGAADWPGTARQEPLVFGPADDAWLRGV